MVAAERKVMLYLSAQHKPGILQGLVVEQPVQFCPLCRGIPILVLHGDVVKSLSDEVDFSLFDFLYLLQSSGKQYKNRR